MRCSCGPSGYVFSCCALSARTTNDTSAWWLTSCRHRRWRTKQSSVLSHSATRKQSSISRTPRTTVQQVNMVMRVSPERIDARAASRSAHQTTGTSVPCVQKSRRGWSRCGALAVATALVVSACTSIWLVEQRSAHCRAKLTRVVDENGKVYQHYEWVRWWKTQRSLGPVVSTHK